MKFIIVLLALVAIVAADISHLDSTTTEQSSELQQHDVLDHPTDLSPAASEFNPSEKREYLPPQARSLEPEPAHTFGADGYRYKTPENRFFF